MTDREELWAPAQARTVHPVGSALVVNKQPLVRHKRSKRSYLVAEMRAALAAAPCCVRHGTRYLSISPCSLLETDEPQCRHKIATPWQSTCPARNLL